MSIDHSFIGFPLSSKGPETSKELEQIIKYKNEGYGGHMQLYIVPGTTDEDIQKIKDQDLNIIIHAPSAFHNFNMAEGLTDLNKQLIDSALHYATKLNARSVVFHPGHVTDNTQDTYDAGENQMREVLQYIKDQSNIRILIENMPIKEEKCYYLLAHPFENLFYEIKETFGFGFCLDITTVNVNKEQIKFFNKPPKKNIKNLYREGYGLQMDRIFHTSEGAIYLPAASMALTPDELKLIHPEIDANIFPFGSDWRGKQKILEESEKHLDYMEWFMRHNPELMHTRGVSFGDLNRFTQGFTQLNLGLHINFIAEYCYPNITVIIEDKTKSIFRKGKMDLFIKLLDQSIEKIESLKKQKQ